MLCTFKKKWNCLKPIGLKRNPYIIFWLKVINQFDTGSCCWYLQSRRCNVRILKIFLVSFASWWQPDNAQSTTPLLFLNMHNVNISVYTCQFFYIFWRDIFYLRVPRFFVGSDYIWRCPKTFRRLPKMLRRVPSNTNTGTQRNIDFATKKRKFGQSRSST